MPPVSTTTESKTFIAGVESRAYRIVQTGVGSGEEVVIAVPKMGTITLLKWELTTNGSSSTMQPSIRTATGAWDGSGANAIEDVTRGTAGATQGSQTTEVPYYAPGGFLYVRGAYDNATEDAAGVIVIGIVKGM